MNLSSELRIRTPEGIVFSYALAGPVTRFMAWLVDLLVIIGLVYVLLFATAFFAIINADIAQGLSILAYFVVSIGYGIALEWAWRGQTVGKRMLRLRVTDSQGLRLRFHQILLRNLVRAIDCLPAAYLVGGLTCLLSRRAQRLGDLAAGTIVVHIPRYAEPDLEQLLAGKYNSLRAHPHLAARLVQRVSPSEARIALQALIRREEIEPAARVQLFAELADHFKEVVAFPAETVEAMPDEQYVRNIVDILFRASS